MYRIVQKSAKGNMLKLAEEGQDDKKASWYFLTDPVQRFAKSFNVGDELTAIETEKKPDGVYITRMTPAKRAFKPKSEGSYSSKPAYTPSGSSSTASSSRGYYDKSPETQESIVRQSVLKAVATMVSTIKFTKVSDLVKTVDTLFEHYLNIVNKGLTAKKEEEATVVVSETDIHLYDDGEIIP